MKPSSVVINNFIIDSPQHISEFLSEGSVNFIKRVRSADNCTIGVEESYIPTSVISSIDNDILKESISTYVESVLNKKISHAKQTLEASIASEGVANLLDIHNGAPVLILNRTSFLDDGTPFEFTKATFRGDRYKYIVELNR